ncbi:MAG: hypothetical protein ABGZ17_02025, partial [Planctomycetaceae bacterium]
MRGLPHLSAILLSLGCPSVGCRLVDSGVQFFQRSHDVAEVSPSSDGELSGDSLEFRDGLLRALNHDTWNSNSQWSAVAAWDARSGSQMTAHSLRWRLGGGEIHRWLDEQQRLVGRRSVDQALRELSRRDDLVGYNATIVWAQCSPALAKSVSDVLQRLSGPSPPSYLGLESDSGAQAEQGTDGSRRRRRVLSPAMRAAAAEAWCRVLARGLDDPQARLSAAARVLRNGGLPPLVTAEYFQGLSRWIAPDLIPRLPESLDSYQRTSNTASSPMLPELRSAALR